MRHYRFLNDSDREHLFFEPPQEFSAADSADVLAASLGATLYSSASRPRLAADLAKQSAAGVTSVVVCLEDSVPDESLLEAELNAIAQLRLHAATDPDGPLIFIRVRSAEQIPMMIDGLGEAASVVVGFVLPKFTARTGPDLLSAVSKASDSLGRKLWAMPVLESPEIIYAESRTDELMAVKDLLQEHRDEVLAVRIGATDLSSAYGLRRGPGMSIYDVRVVASLIADVVNVFGRADGTGFAVTGPVWEYFSGSERLTKPSLRETPFRERSERELREELITADLDGLMREVELDKVNGLSGKSVIHPTHVTPIHALLVVTHEEFSDACDILSTNAGGGVKASSYSNKMNESKPHTAWARGVITRARLFGVANPDVTFVDLLVAGLQQ